MPSKTTHTPGPWQIAPNSKNNITFRIWRTDLNQPNGANRGYACITSHLHGAANARLVAAAPDMLEAGQPLADFINAYDRENNGRAPDDNSFIATLGSKDAPRMRITVGMLREFASAIAKARGGN